MSLIVKICGLSTPEALDAALDAGADMVGFVFFPPSPRHLGFEAARAAGQRVRGRARKVALTVDADDALLDAIVEVVAAGHAATSRQGNAGARRGAQKALRPAGHEGDRGRSEERPFRDRSLCRRLPTGCCSMPARRARRLGPGGLGKSFDWHLLEHLEPGVPFMLSGGLDAGNVGEALRITRAPGVDVSSGVERAPGEKDLDKIRAFVRAAREAAARLPSKPVASPA